MASSTPRIWFDHSPRLVVVSSPLLRRHSMRLATSLVLSSALLLACTPKGPKKTGILIGFSMDTLKEERWQRDRDLVVAECQALGGRVLVQAANGDDALQNAQAENLLTQGVDVLLVAPHNGKTAAVIVEAAHRAGVPA